MTTLFERHQLIENETPTGDLRQRIKGAVVTSAAAILAEGNASNERLAWATSAFSDPAPLVAELFNYLIGANPASTVAQIQALTDTAVQNGVDAAIDARYPPTP